MLRRNNKQDCIADMLWVHASAIKFYAARKLFAHQNY
jgi:hypothetical protein